MLTPFSVFATICSTDKTCCLWPLSPGGASVLVLTIGNCDAWRYAGPAWSLPLRCHFVCVCGCGGKDAVRSGGMIILNIAIPGLVVAFNDVLSMSIAGFTALLGFAG